MKKTALLLVLLLLAAAVYGCGGKSETENAEVKWSITVEGMGDSPVSFTNVDAAKLEMKKVEATKKKKDGTEVTETWEGVALKDVLKALGVTDFQSVVMEAADGYAQEYSKEIVERDGTILGLKVDGKELDEEKGPVQAVPEGEPGSMYIKNLAKIIVQ
ncbi:MAG: molybdopterin-dependent oxidoreductase [Firmicutes bacterium]|jgi:DMSO/TMAO reductase YedYZ molybdopterin-dependent catalytic subunit|nr:molybdopterin-dependent oxidoreductase [Bacillota bacterium]